MLLWRIRTHEVSNTASRERKVASRGKGNGSIAKKCRAEALLIKIQTDTAKIWAAMK